MPTQIHTFANGVRLSYNGPAVSADLDLHEPIADKNEWGVDTLRRDVLVCPHRLTNFIGNTRQGNTHSAGGITYYLQQIQPSDDQYYTIFSLLYKGLRNGIPDQQFFNERCELVSSLSAANLSVSYQGKTIVAARSEVKYISPMTTWRFISSTEPTGPRNGSIRGASDLTAAGLQTLTTYTSLTFSDGTTGELAGAAPAAVSTALFRMPYVLTIGPRSQKIIGTPYYEGEETCRLQYPGS